MNIPTPPRLELYRRLKELFTTYRLLTERLYEQMETIRPESLLELMDLRQETLRVIDELENANPDAFGLPIEEERDPQMAALRRVVRDLAEECRALETGLTPRFEEELKALRADTCQLSVSQRKVRGYTQQIATYSRYVEHIE